MQSAEQCFINLVIDKNVRQVFMLFGLMCLKENYYASECTACFTLFDNDQVLLSDD